MPTFRLLVNDWKHALRLWRVWRFLGLQDIKLRFRRSFIGPLWLLLYTGFFVGGAAVFYGVMFAQPIAEIVPFLAAGIVIWSFIVSSFTESGMTFVVAEGYIKQFNYPKQIYLFRGLVCNTVILAIGLSALVPVQMVFHSFTLLGWAMAIPGFALLLLAALAHITLCAYLGARFRDLPHAMASVFQVLFFVTPILFPAKILAERKLDLVYQLNPIYYLIDVVRHPILTGEFSAPQNYLIACLYIILAWVAALLTARRLDNQIVFLL